MVDAYANVIVIRHMYEGAAKFAAELADVPVVNGGDGMQHHPTQAMIDLYTIWKEFGRIDGLHVAIVADLRHARLMASLCHALAYFDVKLSLISPPGLGVRREIRDYLEKMHVPLYESHNLKDVIEDVDVICMSRIMQERFADRSEYERLKKRYVVDLKAIQGAKDSMIILHALPRVDELPPEIDGTRNARYFQQAAYGIPVRMAILSLILGARG
jgi:aspartate carbamoyltransferase catalytic subunit